MRIWVALIGVLVALAACGSGDEPAPSTDGEGAGPEEVVSSFFDALAAGDYQATAASVDETQLALLTAIEGASPAEVRSMLEGGVPADVRDAFWGSFAGAFPDFSEQTVDRATVGTPDYLEDDRYAAIPVSLPNAERPAGWMLRAEDPAWRIDLFATFGPVFAPNLADWFDAIPAGDDRDVIAASLADQSDSLRIGVAYEPLGPLGEEAVAGVDRLIAAAGA